MNYTIRPMTREDAPQVIDMMRVFYASPAVLSNGSEAILRLEVEEENERAIHAYRKCGFEVLPYMEMKR